ncbi:MFS transporter, partial [Escherichia coli]|uniref:MFS transporter n=1 Tax=Escherichia coli TaxID=562 RepID=UPI0020295160
LMMNPVPWLQMTNMISYQGLVRTFLKQLAMIFMSVLAGNMYESIGFQGAYLVLGLVALGFTLISVFTLSGPGPLSLLRRQVNEVA